MRILGFGGCRINNCIWFAEENDPRVARNNGVPLLQAFAFNETLQVMDVWSGHISIPAELLPVLTRFPDGFVYQPHLVSDADVILMEVLCQAEYVLDGYAVNRTLIVQKLILPVSAVSRAAHAVVHRWFRCLNAFDVEGYRELRKQVLECISDEMENAELLRHLVRNLVSQKANPEKDFRAVMDRINAPIGYVTHTWQFMADGRQIHIPEGFYDELLDAAKSHGLPILYPERYIEEYGVDRALKADLRHYSDEFTLVMTDKLIGYAIDLSQGTHRPSTI